MTEAEILQELTGIFREVFDDPALVIAPGTAARHIKDWDSARMVMLVLAVEQKFGIRMRGREIDALRCVGDFVDLIQRHIHAA